MKTSVVMATYNGAAFLQEQLASLAVQTRRPDQLVVSDDGSEDASLEIVKAFAATAPFPVMVIAHRQRRGYPRNFMSAVNACSGDLIFFCDQDDVWHGDKIAVIAGIAADAPETVISHDISVFGEDPARPRFPSYYQYLRDEGLPPAVCFKGCALAVKADFIRTWGWPPPTPEGDVSHDFWVALLATAFETRRLVDRPLVRHRLHAHNTSGWIASGRGATPRGDGLALDPGRPSDVGTLIDLCVQPWNLAWTDRFLEAIERRVDCLEPRLVQSVVQSLRENRRRHAGPA